MNNKIYPLAFTLSPGQTCPLYYLGFPKPWKDALLDIARKNNPHFKDEYGLPTNVLKKLIESWMDGVIDLAPLKKDSRDDHWLTSCYAYSEEDIRVLCELLKVWVKGTYVTSPRVSPMVKKLATNFCKEIKADEFLSLQSSSTVCLTLDNGTVCEEAYRAVPLLATNHLLGKEVVLCGQTLQLCYSTKNQLISHPLSDPNSQHQYSFVFDFSVQTTPPKRKALLLCQMSIRRWVPDALTKDRAPILKENINAHIEIGRNKYCQVQIVYNYASKQVNWKEQDKECYNIWGYEQLPPAEDVLMNPAAYAPHIILPYKNGIWGMKKSKIGTGVSVVDKASLSQSIFDLLRDMVSEQPEATRISLRGQNFSCLSDPQKYANPEEFRKWVSKCVETDEIVFEIYGLWKDPAQHKLLQQIQTKIENDFGPNSETSCLRIRCACKEVGDLTDAMPDDRKETKIRHRDEIADTIGETDIVTACMFALPGQEQYPKGDPKQVIRNAFAKTGRVVQFITPEETGDFNKIQNAVYDLYRQLGIVTLLDFSKNVPPFADTPCIGMHLCTQVHGIANKARFLPLYVTVNIPEGKTRVHCDAFSERVVSYRKACLEMAKLFWNSDLEQRCVDASRTPAKQKLIELKNHYYTKENSVLLVLQSDGNTRAVWSGLSDKEIGRYDVVEPYCPAEINVGMPKSPYMMSLIDSGVRIVRIRSNQEVPDYYTGPSKKHMEARPQLTSSSGIFQYDDVYWGIHAKPNDLQYTNSFKTSRIDRPSQRFAEKDMIELYPLQLQPGDKAENWVFYTNALRHIPIQYNQSLVLPLPLHLAECLEEYLFDA
jgi:hypothetical protein